MKATLAWVIGVILVLAMPGYLLAASAPTFLDFENSPPLPTGPSLFSQAGPEADVTLTGVATISGGVVLGDATNLPSQSFATSPNLYGTASTSEALGVTADPSLLSTLTINIDPAYSATEVSFPIFNGNIIPVIYTITAFDGATQVGQQVFTDLPSNLSSGFGTVDIKAADITQITITPDLTPGDWDFFVDSIAFNQPVQAVFGVPVPAAAGTGLVGLSVVGLLGWRRRRALAMQ